MGLCLNDCAVGTIVDHADERRKDGKRVARETIRRGIIVKVDGDPTSGSSCTGVHVQFGVGEKPVLVSTGELNRVFKATSRVAREAYRRIVGEPRDVGRVFTSRAPGRRRVVDLMAVTPKPQVGIVAEEYREDDEIAGMDIPDKQA